MPQSRQPSLKPQDLVVLLALCTPQGAPDTYDELAGRAGLSKSEAHAAIARLQDAGLVRADAAGFRAVAQAAREAILAGAPWMFPPVRGAATRGVPTAWGIPSLRVHFNVGADAEVPVWPHPDGTSFGPSITPLYRTVPEAAQADPKLHELLALFDALRSGRARERALARSLLQERLP